MMGWEEAGEIEAQRNQVRGQLDDMRRRWAQRGATEQSFDEQNSRYLMDMDVLVRVVE